MGGSYSDPGESPDLNPPLKSMRGSRRSHRDHHSRQLLSPVPQDTTSTQSIRVLLVDDSSNERAIHRRMLERQHTFDIEVLEADSGGAGLEAFAREQPDVVLLDYHLGDMQGDQFLLQFGRRWPGVQPPVVVLTGDSEPHVAVRVMKYGALDFLTKGAFEPDTLCLAIVQVLTATERRRESERLLENEARLRAEKAEEIQAKSAFLANVSHEIRTPLTAILGFAEELRDEVGDRPEPPSPREVQSVDLILENSRHLLSIVNDILDLSKIEAGSMSVERVEMDLVSIAQSVFRVFEAPARRKGIDLRLEFGTPVPERIESDPVRVRQILLNLVGNAIKFTERGSVEIRVDDSASPGGDAPSTVQVSVLDTGIGMDEAGVAKLFRPFTQAEGTATTRKYGGTGLGLVISKQLAIMLGGDISVRSVLGQGSMFRMWVETGDCTGAALVQPEAVASGPWAAAGIEESAGAGDPLVAPRDDAVRVLVADDSAANRLLMRRILARHGVSVTEVPDGQQAVDAVLEAVAAGRPFDAVLLDRQMPELDGHEAARRLRGEGYQGTLIAWSADTDPDTQRRAREVGFDAVVTKPVDRRILIERLEEFTGRSLAV